MGTPTQVYVDPSIAGNSGTGTSGDPYGDLQYALDQTTRDSTNGDQFNIKAGTAEVLSSALSFATYGTPSVAAPCIFRGYTSTANDGGIAEIDGNGGNFAILGQDYTHAIDMNLHNTGTAAVVSLARSATNCEIHNSTGGLVTAANCIVTKCHLYDCNAAAVIKCKSLFFSFIDNTQTKATSIRLVDTTGQNFVAMGNIFVMGANAAQGIDILDDRALIVGNSFYSTGGTGAAIAHGADRDLLVVMDNLIEGFSGTGGAGIDGESRSEGHTVIAGNAVYNCTTAYANSADYIFSEDNETLSASPFAKSGSATYANRLTFFEPADTGNVYGGAFGQQ